jgi:peptidyl-prolyl cis-trans isomerase SurA
VVTLPEEVRLSEILISASESDSQAKVSHAEAKAENVREEIRRGMRFEDAARAESQGPSAKEGGELGYFSRGNLGTKMEQPVFAMNVGDVSDVLRTKQGFVIVQVTDHI